MVLYPAIDILAGQAVRLTQGRFDDATVYDADPVEAARAWAREGARFLHVVDLDGARQGAPANLHHLKRIVAEVGLPVQYGGGLRSPQAIRDALAAGATRAILGTAAYADVDLLDGALREHPGRIVVSVDGRGGMLSTSGWTETTQVPVEAVVTRLRDRGVTRFVFSDIERDGMLTGPVLDQVRAVGAAVRGRFIYSGGVGSLADLEALAGLRQVNLAGVIVGKALYERRFTVAEAHAALDGR